MQQSKINAKLHKGNGYMQKGSARVAKLGQRRKVEGLVLSGPRVQIPSLAPSTLLFLYILLLRLVLTLILLDSLLHN